MANQREVQVSNATRKPHHTRRKSGHISTNSSMTDLTRHKRPTSTMTRRITPSTPNKLGRSPRDSERDYRDDDDGLLFDFHQDERESFPQYCMNCEKEFLAYDRSIYCSDECRAYDEAAAPSSSSGRGPMSDAYMDTYPLYSSANPEPRDIVPRATPSRPGSMHFLADASPGTSGSGGVPYQSAISALRSIQDMAAHSPPSPTQSSGIWPFSRSMAANPSMAYGRPSSTFFPSTYDGYYESNYSVSTTDRQLPSRRPGAYSRPKSIELVTPVLGR